MYVYIKIIIKDYNHHIIGTLWVLSRSLIPFIVIYIFFFLKKKILSPIFLPFKFLRRSIFFVFSASFVVNSL